MSLSGHQPLFSPRRSQAGELHASTLPPVMEESARQEEPTTATRVSFEIAVDGARLQTTDDIVENEGHLPFLKRRLPGERFAVNDGKTLTLRSSSRYAPWRGRERSTWTMGLTSYGRLFVSCMKSNDTIHVRDFFLTALFVNIVFFLLAWESQFFEFEIFEDSFVKMIVTTTCICAVSSCFAARLILRLAVSCFSRPQEELRNFCGKVSCTQFRYQSWYRLRCLRRQSTHIGIWYGKYPELSQLQAGRRRFGKFGRWESKFRSRLNSEGSYIQLANDDSNAARASMRSWTVVVIHCLAQIAFALELSKVMDATDTCICGVWKRNARTFLTRLRRDVCFNSTVNAEAPTLVELLSEFEDFVNGPNASSCKKWIDAHPKLCESNASVVSRFKGWKDFDTMNNSYYNKSLRDLCNYTFEKTQDNCGQSEAKRHQKENCKCEHFEIMQGGEAPKLPKNVSFGSGPGSEVACQGSCRFFDWVTERQGKNRKLLKVRFIVILTFVIVMPAKKRLDVILVALPLYMFLQFHEIPYLDFYSGYVLPPVSCIKDDPEAVQIFGGSGSLLVDFVEVIVRILTYLFTSVLSRRAGTLLWHWVQAGDTPAVTEGTMQCPNQGVYLDQDSEPVQVQAVKLQAIVAGLYESANMETAGYSAYVPQSDDSPGFGDSPIGQSSEKIIAGDRRGCLQAIDFEQSVKDLYRRMCEGDSDPVAMVGLYSDIVGISKTEKVHEVFPFGEFPPCQIRLLNTLTGGLYLRVCQRIGFHWFGQCALIVTNRRLVLLMVKVRPAISMTRILLELIPSYVLIFFIFNDHPSIVWLLFLLRCALLFFFATGETDSLTTDSYRIDDTEKTCFYLSVHAPTPPLYPDCIRMCFPCFESWRSVKANLALRMGVLKCELLTYAGDADLVTERLTKVLANKLSMPTDQTVEDLNEMVNEMKGQMKEQGGIPVEELNKMVNEMEGQMKEQRGIDGGTHGAGKSLLFSPEEDAEMDDQLRRVPLVPFDGEKHLQNFLVKRRLKPLCGKIDVGIEPSKFALWITNHRLIVAQVARNTEGYVCPSLWGLFGTTKIFRCCAGHQRMVLTMVTHPNVQGCAFSKGKTMWTGADEEWLKIAAGPRREFPETLSTSSLQWSYSFTGKDPYTINKFGNTIQWLKALEKELCNASAEESRHDQDLRMRSSAMDHDH